MQEVRPSKQVDSAKTSLTCSSLHICAAFAGAVGMQHGGTTEACSNSSSHAWKNTWLQGSNGM